MIGGQTSLEVGFAAAFVATTVGVMWGAVSGFFGGVRRRRDDAHRRHRAVDPDPAPAHRDDGAVRPPQVRADPRHRRRRLAHPCPAGARRDPHAADARVRPGGPGDGRHRPPDRAAPHHPELDRHDRRQRHLPGRRRDLVPRALGFLGLGVAAPTTDWGSMLSTARLRSPTATGGRSTPPALRSSSPSSPSTSSATRCGTRSRSGCSAASGHRAGRYARAGAGEMAGGDGGRVCTTAERRPSESMRAAQTSVEAVTGSATGGCSGKWQAARWPGPNEPQRGLLGGADLLRVGAPGPEAAARRRVDRRRQLAA